MVQVIMMHRYSSCKVTLLQMTMHACPCRCSPYKTSRPAWRQMEVWRLKHRESFLSVPTFAKTNVHADLTPMLVVMSMSSCKKMCMLQANVYAAFAIYLPDPAVKAPTGS